MALPFRSIDANQVPIFAIDAFRQPPQFSISTT